ncbi:MAG TPA: multidrug effflux MFS transporter [Steroidobacteraceae bacterium]|nr:multidrug effflux MFS transporter [Steroidobacteraceae bacterium]
MKDLGFRELVVLTAAMMACQALAIDAMLPALPTIGAALGISDANRVQWIVLAYIVGLGCGQLFWGMFSDRFGRRRILLIGIGCYALAGVLCGFSRSFPALLAWRFVHGAAAASVVIARSVIRDLYSGRRMARVMSLTFIVFLMSPVVAPSLGQLLLLVAPWRSLFLLIGAFGVGVWCWSWLRLPETLHPQYRLPLQPARIVRALRLVLGHRAALFYALGVAWVMGALFAYVSTVQQIFADIFHRASWMPGLFAVCAAAMGAASYMNSRLVERLGMRVISHSGLMLLLAASLVHLLLALLGADTLLSFTLLQAVTLACVGLITANFGTLAMEPMGAVAGIAASLQGFIGMTGGALSAALIGRMFQGSTVPLALGSSLCALGALGCVLVAEQGRMFREPQRLAGHHAATTSFEPL